MFLFCFKPIEGETAREIALRDLNKQFVSKQLEKAQQNETDLTNQMLEMIVSDALNLLQTVAKDISETDRLLADIGTGKRSGGRNKIVKTEVVEPPGTPPEA